MVAIINRTFNRRSLVQVQVVIIIPPGCSNIRPLTRWPGSAPASLISRVVFLRGGAIVPNGRWKIHFFSIIPPFLYLSPTAFKRKYHPDHIVFRECESEYQYLLDRIFETVDQVHHIYRRSDKLHLKNTKKKTIILTGITMSWYDILWLRNNSNFRI